MANPPINTAATVRDLRSTIREYGFSWPHLGEMKRADLLRYLARYLRAEQIAAVIERAEEKSTRRRQAAI